MTAQGVIIRPAVPGDLEFICAATVATFQEHQDTYPDFFPGSADYLVDLYKAALAPKAPPTDVQLLVAELDGICVGYVAVSLGWLGGGRDAVLTNAAIIDVFVEPSARRKGVALALLRRVRDYAGTAQILAQIWPLNEGSLSLFAAAGYLSGPHNVTSFPVTESGSSPKFSPPRKGLRDLFNQVATWGFVALILIALWHWLS